MRRIVKTANRFDTVWTAFVMFPAVILLMNAAISLHQGKASPAEFTRAANVLATKFSAQYTPYIETTGTVLTAGAKKLFKAISACTGSHNPVYINPAMAKRSGCALGRTSKIRPYRHY